MKSLRKVLFVLGIITVMFGSVLVVSAEEKPDASRAREESDIVELRIGDVEIVANGVVTGQTYPGVSFDDKNNILTLKNADIKVEPKADGRRVRSALYIEGNEANLKIDLTGDNKLEFTEEISSDMISASMVEISGSFEKVVFSGSGSLNIHCGANVGTAIDFSAADSGKKDVAGYERGLNLTMDGGQIDIIGDIMSEKSFVGIDTWFGGFVMNSGELNITGEAISGDPSQFIGIYTRNPSDKGIHILGGTVNIKGPDYCSRTQWGMDSQCGDITFRNANVKIHLGRAYASSFALLCGNEDHLDNQVYPGAIIVEDSYVECRTGGADQNYSSYFFDLINKEDLYFYVGENIATKEVSFEEAFEWGGHWSVADRYESIYRCFTISSEKLEFDVIPGDINGDTSVDLSDLMLCLHHVSGSSTLRGDSLLAADLDGNGSVDLSDLMQLLHQVSGS